MSVEQLYRWQSETALLEEAPAADASPVESPILAADSWLVTDGSALALQLHRDRFLEAVHEMAPGITDAEAFWDAALATIPRTGAWFPRVQVTHHNLTPQLSLLVRSAPERTKSVVVTSATGPDPRQHPLVKGPDLERMSALRASATREGAGEAVVLTTDGFVVEGAYSALLWWRGQILCAPPLEFERIDSVTVRSVLALAAALGVETYQEAVTPAELEGTEVWALNALHGPRIVTEWVRGPGVAELPGRLTVWRTRLDALRRPL
ncbi:MAG TPA: aminotransferase class IV [Glaciihabitans sp.]|jgi:branched-subunit amino acid aminotransferase/4-amino-4-deoxychorismate lyase|nr:aminotransferase class IV [Glaciihabitans sp.]